jgi:hypothetical protein
MPPPVRAEFDRTSRNGGQPGHEEAQSSLSANKSSYQRTKTEQKRWQAILLLRHLELQHM